MNRADPLLMESPYSGATRPLTGEPLTLEDWQQVYEAHRAFIAQVRMVVVKARTRSICPMCEQSQSEPSCERREHWG